MAHRMQLTLFVEPPENLIIEEIRRRYNPIQFKLINCHVTLCREDVIGEIDRIIENLDCLIKNKFIITFGNVIKFSDGKGIMLEGDGDNFSFHELRNKVLKGVVNNPQRKMATLRPPFLCAKPRRAGRNYKPRTARLRSISVR